MKQFYYAVAVSNFKTENASELAESILYKLNQHGIMNVVTNKKCDLFKQFADGYKFIREEELSNKELDWSFFPSSRCIITEIILDTMAFLRGSKAAWVRVIKHTKPNLEVMYLISVVDE